VREEEIDEHLDPTAEISLEAVKNRAVKGVAALTGRYFILYLITLVASGFFGSFFGSGGIRCFWSRFSDN